MSRWFRFYAEALDDPKVQMLAPERFKAWVNILCLAAKGDGSIVVTDNVAFALRVTFQDLTKLVAEFEEAGLLDNLVNSYEPHNWKKRQYKSDTSTERVGRYRERKRNVSETPPDYRLQKESSPSKPLNEVRRDQVSPNDPVLQRPDDPLAAYSETELKAMAFEFDGLDVESAVCDLAHWARKRGITDPIEWKSAIYGALKKRYTKAKLHDAMQSPEPATVSPQLAASKLVRRTMDDAGPLPKSLDRRKQHGEAA